MVCYALAYAWASAKTLPADVVAAKVFTPVSGVIGEEYGYRAFVSDACVEVAAEAICPARRRAHCKDDLVINGF